MPEPYFTSSKVTLHHGDCLDVLQSLPDASVDAVVTDPPYGLGFMGKEWDELPPGEDWARECFRVLKPGGHLLAFGGTRTWHRLAVAVEDAGFELRDSLAWLYGSGFPKSLDVSKAIDKLDAADARLVRAREFQAWLREHVTAQQVNEATGTDMGHHYTTHPTQPSVATVAHLNMLRPLLPEVPQWVDALARQRTVESENFKRRKVVGSARMVDTQRSRLGFAGETYGGDSSSRDVDLTHAHTDAARTWQGWGTALKPAFEPIIVGRKPLVGTVAANVLAHGAGALNVDACRVGSEGGRRDPGADSRSPESVSAYGHGLNGRSPELVPGLGRWPANVILDESQAEVLDEQSGERPAGGKVTGNQTSRTGESGIYGTYGAVENSPYGDTGGASRFFYVAKADASERPRVDGVAHPTVKPLALMRWLVRLVTPPDGTVLEPFAGSGTTVEACILEGFKCVAIEREADYLPLIMRRIERPGYRPAPPRVKPPREDEISIFDEVDA